MSAGKISCRWHRPDRFLGASQACLTSRLTPQESLDPEDLSRVHDVVWGRSALLIARMTLTAFRRARRVPVGVITQVTVRLYGIRAPISAVVY